MILLTAAQMQEIERRAIDGGRVTGLVLMERAGHGFVDAMFAEWPSLATAPHKATVLCGPGNNGGDGFVIARLLQERGWDVSVYLHGRSGRLPPDARANFERWRRLGPIHDIVPDGRSEEATPPARIGNDLNASDVIVDALMGTGLNRAYIPPDGINRWFRVWSASDGSTKRARVVAVDIVSGLDADSGKMLASEEGRVSALWADLTVTFHQPKRGHFLEAGPVRSTALRCADIGLGDSRGDETGASLLSGGTLVRVPDPEPPAINGGASLNKGVSRRGAESHKYTHGHALVLSGGVGKGGAARLAARGALRVGAGLVTLGCPRDAVPENAARLDAIMLTTIDDPGSLREYVTNHRINALCVGPGLGLDAASRKLVLHVLATGLPTVLDADALSLFQDDPDALFGVLHAGCVLTPHGGEFGRLFPAIRDKLHAPATRGPAYSKVDATSEAARRSGSVVLYKGADTVIASPDGHCSLNAAHYDRAAPWLATAGSGDVLAGFIAGLLARGFPPHAAAETGAVLHVACARRFGPGLIAEDLPEQIPAVFRALGL